MARQKPRREDDASTTTPTPAERPSRADRRRAKRSVVEGRVALAERLVALPVEALPALDLDDELFGELELARRLKPSGAKNRQVRYLAKLLVGEEDALEAVLGGLADGTIVPVSVARTRAEALLTEGDAGIAELCAEQPLADRGRLHRLVRQGDVHRLAAYLETLDG